ncbi:hypothetical protein KW797_02990 [Candidatus Parcubacteria bacterium]|nr:hypothetical protein [Candidatus Parcubacteria bacterium]
MRVIACRLIGRFGNNCFTYAYARALAEQRGAQLQCDPWVGNDIFGLNDPPITEQLPQRDETTLQPDEVNVAIKTYAQNQACLIYTREQVRRWFTLRPSLVAMLERLLAPDLPIVAHLRRGDYLSYGYVAVARKSYERAAGGPFSVVSDDTPTVLPEFPYPLDFLPDFYRLMRANVLLRANSSFSYWAGVLGNQERVLSPIIDGLPGGVEHDCTFTEGNWPKFANLDGITNLNLRES